MFSRTFSELKIFDGARKLCDVLLDANLVTFGFTVINSLAPTSLKFAINKETHMF